MELSNRLYLAVLRDDEANPLARESDEEKTNAAGLDDEEPKQDDPEQDETSAQSADDSQDQAGRFH